jgi:hypothetical protein
MVMIRGNELVWRFAWNWDTYVHPVFWCRGFIYQNKDYVFPAPVTWYRMPNRGGARSRL